MQNKNNRLQRKAQEWANQVDGDVDTHQKMADLEVLDPSFGESSGSASDCGDSHDDIENLENS